MKVNLGAAAYSFILIAYRGHYAHMDNAKIFSRQTALKQRLIWLYGAPVPPEASLLC